MGGKDNTEAMTTNRNPHYTVRKSSSTRASQHTYNVFKVGGGRMNVHPFSTRNGAQAACDELNIAAMVRPQAEDDRPYAVRLAEARELFAAMKDGA